MRTAPINLKVADFLDVTLNLNSENYYPYRKPNNWPIYNHSESNYQPNIVKNLPAFISRRLTDILSDETAFGDAKPTYDKVLAHRGFCEKTEFLEDRKGRSEKRKRKRTVVKIITCLHPLYSQIVSTNSSRRFRTLISKHF